MLVLVCVSREKEKLLACNKQFLLFQQCFISRLENFLPIFIKFELSSENSFNLEKAKISCLGKD